MIHGVPPEDFASIYPQIAEHFASFVARSRGDLAPGKLEADIMAAQRQCYVPVVDGEIKGALVTRVGGDGRIHVEYGAGKDMASWGDAWRDFVLAWAADRGCGVRVVCRPGWVRALRLKDFGFRETHKVMEVG